MSEMNAKFPWKGLLAENNRFERITEKSLF